MSDRSDRQHWEKRIREAKERVDFASAFARGVKRDFDSGAVTPRQGMEAYNRALRAEEAALRVYARVVRMLGIRPAARPAGGVKKWPQRSGKAPHL